jgi:hypothetical protein
VVSIGEIERGNARQRIADPAFAEELATWLKRLLHLHDQRLLAVDLPVARRWRLLSAALGHDAPICWSPPPLWSTASPW